MSNEWYNQGSDEVEKERKRIEEAREAGGLQEWPGSRMGDGDKIKLIFAEPKLFKGLKALPITLRRHWYMVDGKRRPFTCVAEECILCQRGDSPRFTVIYPTLMEEKGKWTAILWVRGSQCAGNIQALKDEKALYGKVISTTRKGLSLDTEYYYVPVADIDIKTIPEELAKLEEFWMKFKPKTREDIEELIGTEGRKEHASPFEKDEVKY